MPGSCSWTYNFFFFGTVGEGNIEVHVEVQEAGTVLISGVMLGGGVRLLRYTLHTLPIICS